MSSGAAASRKHVLSPAAEAACYATGFFSLGLVPMMSLAVPLWCLELGAAPYLIGIAVGARSVLPFLLSIHGGVVMDRLGVRRVMFWLAGVCIVLVPLYPLLRSVVALIALQLVFGLAQGLSWVGAQTQIGQLTKGSPSHAGRFSFAATAGTFGGPPLVGLAWDGFGPWGAFLLVAFWCLALWIAIHGLPRPNGGGEPSQATSGAVGWRDLVPRASDYRAALELLAIPAVGFVVIATFVRIGTLSVQGSFYTVYLESIALSGTAIGSLVAIASVVGSLTSLLAGPLARRIRPPWILIWAIGLSAAAMTATPFLETLAPLAVLAVLFGTGIGLTLPPILSILSLGAGPSRQGLSVGLRTTANRLASLVVPVAMGLLASLSDLRLAFLITGAALALILAWMVRLIVRHRL